MARDHPNVVNDEDYIDMDILCYNKLPSPPHSSSEFEFQMSSSINLQTEHITSPADELFYKGNLLPLYLPPRLQMVEKLLQNPQGSSFNNDVDAANTTSNSTPFESCNISPATSCYVSGELNPEEFFYECQKETKKSWSKKLNLKLKASKAYLKSLFSKTGCNSNETSAVSKTKKSPFGQIQRAASFMKRFDGEKKAEEECGVHRRSFSLAIKRHVPSNKSSSTSSSLCSSSNSSSFSSVNSGGIMLKRSSSVNSESECSVQGAIAYCKKSQQVQVCGRKSVSDVEFYLLSESRIDVEGEKQEKREICKG